MSEDPVRYTDTDQGLQLADWERERLIRERLLERVEELLKMDEGDAPLVAAAQLFQAYSTSRIVGRLSDLENRLAGIEASLDAMEMGIG